MAAAEPLGVGIGYRSAIRTGILQNLREFDFLEVITDSFVRNERALEALSSLVPCLPHSLNLSVGSAVDEAYLERVKGLVGLVKAPWHSDHLAFTRAGGVTIGHLAPVPYNEEGLEVAVRNIRHVQEQVRAPFAVENITMPFYWPNNTMEEHAFLSEVVRRTGCHLLLDLENARINAENHGQDARALLDRLPVERIVQVHIAGGAHERGLAHDTHDAPVSEATWALLEHLCELAPPPAVLLERDDRFPPMGEIVAEVRRARAILGKATR